MDNPVRYGFRWCKGMSTGPTPKPHKYFVASAASFDVNGGAQNIRLRAGDLIRRASSGGVSLCDGAEGAGGELPPCAVVVGLRPYFDGNSMVFSDTLPSDTTYGTNLERQTEVLALPLMPGMVFEVDCDDAVTATTRAAYQAFEGENCSFRNTGAVGELYANPKLDISTHATTGTLVWRIVQVPNDFENFDYSGANVKLYVTPNYVQQPWAAATGPVFGSTGV